MNLAQDDLKGEPHFFCEGVFWNSVGNITETREDGVSPTFSTNHKKKKKFLKRHKFEQPYGSSNLH